MIRKISGSGFLGGYLAGFLDAPVYQQPLSAATGIPAGENKKTFCNNHPLMIIPSLKR